VVAEWIEGARKER